MSAVAAETSAPAGQATLPGIQPAVGAKSDAVPVPAPAVAKDAKPSASILGDLSESKPEEKKTSEQGAQGSESKDGKPADAGELDIKLPEGTQVDAAVLAEFKAAAKEAGLTGESASKLAAWDIQRRAKEASATIQAWDKQGEVWADELKKDPDFGGEKLAETVLAAKSVLRKFGGEALAADLAKMGLGNMPSLVRMLARIGKANKEDSSSGGAGEAPAVPDHESQLRRDYPSMYNADGTPKKVS
jgi:hypothetical protein